MLEVRQLGFSYLREDVLENVDFRVEGGQFISLVGASGCGKSTLLRLVAGLRESSVGTIVKDSPQKATTSFVFQKPTLCPWLSALANVELPLKLRGVRPDLRRSQALQALEMVGLGGADAEKKPMQLSGGMQMRASLARAFVTKPHLMLMDEPFAALDEVLRQQLCELTMRLWRQEGWTTLFVTHNVAEAVFMSQRIHILAGKPASIVESIDIPFEDRSPALRETEEYLSLVSLVSRRLRSAVEASTTGLRGGGD